MLSSLVHPVPGDQLSSVQLVVAFSALLLAGSMALFLGGSSRKSRSDLQYNLRQGATPQLWFLTIASIVSSIAVYMGNQDFLGAVVLGIVVFFAWCFGSMKSPWDKSDPPLSWAKIGILSGLTILAWIVAGSLGVVTAIGAAVLWVFVKFAISLCCRNAPEWI